MKSLLVIALSLVGMSAFAQPAICVGQEGTIGQLQIAMQGKQLLVRGGYRFDDGSGKQARVNVVNCSGPLSNNGQSGIGGHDYYEMNAACPVHYIRTEKDQSGRLNGWISLVVRGTPQEDSSGYEYHFFLCK